MRLVPVNCVRPGTLLGKTLYNSTGNILLKQGIELNDALLARLEENGIFLVYVDDGYSHQEIQDIIQPEVKNRAIESIRNVFELIEKKPKNSPEDHPDVRKMLIQKSMSKYLDSVKTISTQIIESILGSQTLMINLVDIKSYDNKTYEHSLNVAVLSLILGIEAKLSRNQLHSVFIGALLHDIGKVLLPIKANKILSDEDHAALKGHPLKGYEYMKDSRSIDGIAKAIILQHHEHYDGTGYPRGTPGEYVNQASRIVSIANCYDVLTSDTSGGKAVLPNEAMEYLMGGAGTEFDFDLVTLFVRKIIPYPPGTLVTLSNGQIAVVIEVNSNFPLRPIVRYVSRGTGKVHAESVDLMKEYSILITGVQLEDPKNISS